MRCVSGKAIPENAMMIHHTPEYDEFRRKQMAEHELTYEEACRIYESLHQEALQLGAISSANIWDGFEVDLRVTRAMQELARIQKTDETN